MIFSSDDFVVLHRWRKSLVYLRNSLRTSVIIRCRPPTTSLKERSFVQIQCIIFNQGLIKLDTYCITSTDLSYSEYQAVTNIIWECIGRTLWPNQTNHPLIIPHNYFHRNMTASRYLSSGILQLTNGMAGILTCVNYEDILIPLHPITRWPKLAPKAKAIVCGGSQRLVGNWTAACAHRKAAKLKYFNCTLKHYRATFNCTTFFWS